MALIKNNTARILTLGTFGRLVPGVNEIADADWEKASKQSAVKALLQKQEGEEASTLEVSGGGKGQAKEFAAMEEGQQLQLVAQALDPALLEKWSKEAKGESVKEALKQRLVEVSLTPEERAAAEKKQGKHK